MLCNIRRLVHSLTLLSGLSLTWFLCPLPHAAVYTKEIYDLMSCNNIESSRGCSSKKEASNLTMSSPLSFPSHLLASNTCHIILLMLCLCSCSLQVKPSGEILLKVSGNAGNFPTALGQWMENMYRSSARISREACTSTIR